MKKSYAVINHSTIFAKKMQNDFYVNIIRHDDSGEYEKIMYGKVGDWLFEYSDNEHYNKHNIVYNNDFKKKYEIVL